MHGGHHDAQKLTITTLPRSLLNENVPPPSSCPLNAGATLPSSGLFASVAPLTGWRVARNAERAMTIARTASEIIITVRLTSPPRHPGVDERRTTPSRRRAGVPRSTA